MNSGGAAKGGGQEQTPRARKGGEQDSRAGKGGEQDSRTGKEEEQDLRAGKEGELENPKTEKGGEPESPRAETGCGAENTEDKKRGEQARTRLFVGRLLEEPEAAGLVSDEDRRQAAAFPSARRREFLSWRAFLYRELGSPAAIAYEPSGAPRLTDSRLHIGVSHCLTHAAVCWSESRCAVDIELTGRNFERVRSRYLTPDEERLCSRPDWLCIAWCAKECLYKLAGEQGLDLRRDLHLHAASFLDNPLPHPDTFVEPHNGTLNAPHPRAEISSCSNPADNNASTYRTDDDQPLLTLGTLRGSIHNRPATLRILSLDPLRIVLSE